MRQLITELMVHRLLSGIQSSQVRIPPYCGILFSMRWPNVFDLMVDVKSEMTNFAVRRLLSVLSKIN